MRDNKDRPHVKPGKVKYTKGFRARRTFTKVVNTMIILITFLLVALSIYVFVKQPVRYENGYVTATQIYEFVEHGEKVVIVDDEDFNLFTPLTRFLTVQDIYLAEVVAGPYGKIEYSKDRQRVIDGEDVIGVNLESIDDEYLDLEYIVRKINNDGVPIEGEHDLIILGERILGAVNIEK